MSRAVRVKAKLVTTPVLVMQSTTDKSFMKEVYLLNVGDQFPGFGGSSSGLVAQGTASLVIRDRGPWGINDYEFALDDPKQWAFIAARLANRDLKVIV